MPNYKVPQLPVLSIASGGTILYVVDVSDTTDDPSGSSKQITRDNLLKNISSFTATTFYGDGTNLTGVVKGAGTANYLPRWTGTTGLGNSIIQDNGTNVSIGTSPTSTAKFYIYTSSGNQYGLYVRNASSTSNSLGIYGVSDSGQGSQTGLFGAGQGHPTSGTSVGVDGYGTDGLVAIGVRGTATRSEFGSTTTGIGGYFDGRGDGAYGYPTNSFSVQLIDGTEGVNKVLTSMTADGKANWVDPQTVQTKFNYGLVNAIMTGTFLT